MRPPQVGGDLGKTQRHCHARGTLTLLPYHENGMLLLRGRAPVLRAAALWKEPCGGKSWRSALRAYGASASLESFFRKDLALLWSRNKALGTRKQASTCTRTGSTNGKLRARSQSPADTQRGYSHYDKINAFGTRYGHTVAVVVSR
jgi:hypothetical protein